MSITFYFVQDCNFRVQLVGIDNIQSYFETRFWVTGFRFIFLVLISTSFVFLIEKTEENELVNYFKNQSKNYWKQSHYTHLLINGFYYGKSSYGNIDFFEY